MDAIDPYDVQFSADPIPAAVDQSEKNPGSDGVSRAGLTTISFDGKGGLAFDSRHGDARRDGTVPFYYDSVKVAFRLKDFVIRISSDYAPGSCAYKATLTHEIDAHIKAPIRIMNSYRDKLIERLNTVRLPTKASPRWILLKDLDDIDADYQDQVFKIVKAIRAEVTAELRKDKAAQDSPENYQSVYQKCTVVEWKTKRN